MKTIKFVLAAALFSITVLSGCVKDKANIKTNADSIEGSRVIAVSFGPSTKTILDKDGLTPEFKEGDMILVANGKATEACQVVIENNIAVIHTKLEGNLDAVYPASAAENDGYSIYGIRVSPSQSGRFADANICRATIPANSKSATFLNQTAVLKFYVDATIDVQSITIDSSDSIASDSGSIRIDDKTSILSEIACGKSNERICYVAAKAQTNTDLNFSSVTSTQDNVVRKTLTKVALEAGKMYNVFLPYYIKVNVGTKEEPNIQRWAYCNIGAFLPEERGYFFSWGNTQGYLPVIYDEYGENVDWILPSGKPGPKGGFTNNNYSYTSGAALTSDLSSENDAAAAYGDKWRMPTKSEFDNLITGTTWTEVGWEEIDGKRGKYFVDKEGNRIFLPTTGEAYNDNLRYPEHEGHYWSSTCGTDNQAYALNYWSNPNTGEKSRYHGCTIRPIYGTAAPVIPSNALPGEFTVAIDTTAMGLPPTKVHFAKGNLQATYNGSGYTWGFASNQYDIVGKASGNTSIDSQKSGDVVDLFGWVGASSSFTGAAQYGISTDSNDDDYGNVAGEVLKSDWGKTIDDKEKWHTLSRNEWEYLLATREMPNDKARFKNVIGSGITLKDKNNNDITQYGLVLYPDGFADQDSWDQTYKTWDEFDQNGLVLLPAAGSREGSDVSYAGEGGLGYYWTSTSSADKSNSACRIYFTNNAYVFYEETDNRHRGMSIRLVTYIEK